MMIPLELIGLAVTVILAMLGIWWKVESRQDQKIDKLSEQNGKEHRELHQKIDGQHHAVRDRLENIWQHIIKKPGD